MQFIMHTDAVLSSYSLAAICLLGTCWTAYEASYSDMVSWESKWSCRVEN